MAAQALLDQTQRPEPAGTLFASSWRSRHGASNPVGGLERRRRALSFERSEDVVESASQKHNLPLVLFDVASGVVGCPRKLIHESGGCVIPIVVSRVRVDRNAELTRKLT